MSVSFYGTENAVLTFEADTVTAGWPVSLSANNKVQNAPAAAAPMGVALNLRSGHAAVQFHGFVELNYSGTATKLGWNSLVADGTGGMRLAGAGETGREMLVVNVNPTDKVAGLFL